MRGLFNTATFVEVDVPSQESGWSCSCVLGISFLSVSTIILIRFGNFSNSMVFFVFHW